MEKRRSGSNISSKAAKKIPLRNPFLNFLRDFRKSDNRSIVRYAEMVKKGSQLWRTMSDREKSPYIHISRQAPKKYSRKKMIKKQLLSIKKKKSSRYLLSDSKKKRLKKHSRRHRHRRHAINSKRDRGHVEDQNQINKVEEATTSENDTKCNVKDSINE